MEGGFNGQLIIISIFGLFVTAVNYDGCSSCCTHFSVHITGIGGIAQRHRSAGLGIALGSNQRTEALVTLCSGL